MKNTRYQYVYFTMMQKQEYLLAGIFTKLRTFCEICFQFPLLKAAGSRSSLSMNIASVSFAAFQPVFKFTTTPVTIAARQPKLRCKSWRQDNDLPIIVTGETMFLQSGGRMAARNNTTGITIAVEPPSSTNPR